MAAPDDSPLILVAEDEPPLNEIITYNLEKSGFKTLSAFQGDVVVDLVKTHTIDAMILDWMMPGLSGIEICQDIRADPDLKNLPILMLTARGDEADRVHGLDVGVDDYMIKPFSPRELVARLRALLRRTRKNGQDADLKVGPIAININQHKVSIDGFNVALGPTEYRLLQFLMESPGRVFSRQILLDRVWMNGMHVESRTVDVHVRRLRKTLMEVGGIDPIRTVRGVGYSFDLEGKNS